jgi:hypothetical protein
MDTGPADRSTLHGSSEGSPEEDASTLPVVPAAESGRRSVGGPLIAMFALVVVAFVVVGIGLLTSRRDGSDGEDGQTPAPDESVVAAEDDAATETGAAPSIQVATTSPAITTSSVSALRGQVVLAPDLVEVDTDSVLPGSDFDGSTYWPSNMFDGRLETAWNHCGSECSYDEGDPRRDGIGVQLVLTFPTELDVAGLRIANGYQKSTDRGDVWPQNNRIAGLQVWGESGSPQLLHLSDARDFQTLALEPITTRSLVLEVTDVYRGDPYRDLAVSELEVLVLE